jgi:hypothetical protein
VFESHDGQLVLEELKGRFWFYKQPPTIREVGQEDVLKHIQNMINPPPIINPPPKEFDYGQ